MAQRRAAPPYRGALRPPSDDYQTETIMSICYLSGVISGVTLSQSAGWRISVAERLAAEGWTVADPLRGSQAYRSPRKIIRPSEYPPDEPTMSDMAFFSRDLHDISKCDVLLANVLECDKASIGTAFELAWGAILPQCLVVIALTPKGPMDHPFVRHSGVVFHDLSEAVDFVISSAPTESEEAAA